MHQLLRKLDGTFWHNADHLHQPNRTMADDLSTPANPPAYEQVVQSLGLEDVALERGIRSGRSARSSS
jgi:hypothetical protein